MNPVSYQNKYRSIDKSCNNFDDLNSKERYIYNKYFIAILFDQMIKIILIFSNLKDQFLFIG